MEFRLECLKRFAKLLTYFSCLVGVIIFSLDTVKQYMSFNTSFLTIKEPLLLEDLRVINICYQKGEYPKISGRVPHRLSLSWDLDITDVLMATRAFRPVSCWRIELRSKEGMLDSGEVDFSPFLVHIGCLSLYQRKTFQT